MNDTVMQIRISQKLKKQSMAVSEKLGFTTSTLIKLFLQHVVATRKIPFEIQEIPNARLIKSAKQAEIDHKNGNYYSFDDMEDAIAFLKKSIKLKKNASRIKSKLQKSSSKHTLSNPREGISRFATI